MASPPPPSPPPPSPSLCPPGVTNLLSEEECLGVISRYGSCDRNGARARCDATCNHHCIFTEPTPPPPPPPGAKNVLYLIIDDLRNEGGVYLQHHVQTPHLDALAAGGVTFTRAYTQSSLCGVPGRSCRVLAPALHSAHSRSHSHAFLVSLECSAPSRSSFLTGRGPEDSQLWDTFWSSFRTHGKLGTPSVPTRGANWTTLPGHFKRHGWRVYGVGKTIDDINQDWPRSWSRERPHTPYSYQRCPGANRGSQTWCALDPTRFDASEHIDDIIATDLIDAITTADERGRLESPPRPFMIMGGFVRPHGPWMIPQSAWTSHNYSNVPLPAHPARADGPTSAPFHGWSNTSIEIPPMRRQALADGSVVTVPGSMDATNAEHTQFTITAHAAGVLPSAATRLARHAYWAAVTYVDAQVGRVLTHLSQRGLTATTLVVAHSDHGYHLGEYGSWRKGTLYELAARVPLIMRVPWKPNSANTRSSEIIELLDLYQTYAPLPSAPLPSAPLRF